MEVEDFAGLFSFIRDGFDGRIYNGREVEMSKKHVLLGG